MCTCIIITTLFLFPLLSRVSHPSQVVLPFPNWEPKEKPIKEDDVGPQVTHIYEVNSLPYTETQLGSLISCEEMNRMSL